MAPGCYCEAVVGLGEDFCLGVIFSIILTVALPVLVSIFYHGENDDKSERRGHSRLTVGDRNLRDHLHKHDDEEVHIGQLFRELFKEVEEEKVVPCVFTGANNIVSNFFALQQLLQCNLIEVNFPHGLLFGSFTTLTPLTHYSQ